MTYRITLRAAAVRDINQAVQWYEARAPLQGVRFAEELETVKAQIQDSPGLYPIAYRAARRAPLRVFPYFLWYIVDEEATRIRVMAVVHQRQNPEKVKARIT